MDVKAEAYLRLYERQMTHFEKSQELEWKIGFGIWTLLAAASFWAVQNRSATKPIVLDHWLLLLVFALAPIHAFWLWRVYESKAFDKKLWTRYRFEARSLLLAPASVPKDEWESERDLRSAVVWLVLEAGITIVLAIVLVRILW